MYILLVLWILSGIVGVMFAWHTARKEWYHIFNSEYWKHRSETALHVLLILSPILIFLGILLIFLTMLFTESRYWSFYFKLPA